MSPHAYEHEDGRLTVHPVAINDPEAAYSLAVDLIRWADWKSGSCLMEETCDICGEEDHGDFAACKRCEIIMCAECREGEHWKFNGDPCEPRTQDTASK